MSLSDYIPEKFIEFFSDPDFPKAIKGYSMYLIKEDKEYRDEIKTYFNECLITSELKPVQRLADIEAVTGLKDYSEFEEEHAPTLPEQITVLSEKIESLSESTFKPTEEEKDENPIVPNTTLTQKANALTEYLKEKTKPNWSGKLVLENNDIYKFFREIIQEDLRWPEKMRGYRGAKKSIIERAQEMFPNEVEVVRNKSGNKITGLALKASVNRTDTYGC